MPDYSNLPDWLMRLYQGQPDLPAVVPVGAEQVPQPGVLPQSLVEPAEAQGPIRGAGLLLPQAPQAQPWNPIRRMVARKSSTLDVASGSRAHRSMN